MMPNEERAVDEVEVSVFAATSGAIESVSRAETVLQMEFARKYPRSVVQFKREALTLATEDEETAGSCFYALPRAGKTIEGPSVRLAEIVAHCWGHLRVNTRDIEEGEKVVRSQTVCWDMQANVAIGIEAARKITDKNGRRYNEDMIAMTMAACRSVSFRNGIWKVVPFSFVKDIYEQCKETSIGKGLTMEQRREKVLAEWSKYPIKVEELLAVVGAKGVGDLTLDHVVQLAGLRTAIKDGDTTLDSVLAEVRGRATVVGGLTLAQIAKATVTESTDDAKPPVREPKKA
jgi:hypothetical protein